MSKKYFYYFLSLLALFVLQIAALKVWTANGNWVPQLILLFVIFFALTHSLPETVWFGFLAGFLEELFSGHFFGAHIVAIILIGLLLYFVTRNLTTQEVAAPTAATLVILATLFFPLWVFSYHSLAAFLGIAEPLSPNTLYSAKVVATIVINLLFFYPIRLLFRILPK